MFGGWIQNPCRGSMVKKEKPLVGIIMGSQSDWETMQHAAKQLEELKVPFEAQVISAHRAPDRLFEYASSAADRGLEIIIAAAGGAAHLAGVTAAKTALPVLGVPMQSALQGLDSLLSIAQMPAGVPVATVAIDGGRNAGLLAVQMLALADADLFSRVVAFKEKLAESVRERDRKLQERLQAKK